MAYVPLKYPPGVCKVNSPYTDYMEGGRITHMCGMRFNAGYPEVIGRDYNPGFFILFNIARGISDIRFSTAIKIITGETTELTVQSVVSTGIAGAGLVTPQRLFNTGTLTNAFNTVNGTNLVGVTHAAHQQNTGDYVVLGTTTVGGIVIGGVYTNIQVTGTNSYTFLALTSATSTATGGGAVAFSYLRKTLANPFAVSSGVGTATVTHTAHGALTNDSVTFTAGTAVGGVTFSGRYAIRTVIDANTYLVVNSGTATAGTTGGGDIQVRYTINSDADRIWSLSRYGNGTNAQMLCCPIDDTIYVWDSQEIGLNKAYPLNNAPTGVKFMFVTPERFVFALGNSDNPMQVRWPDQNDYTNWTPTDGNTANIRTLQEGAALVGGIPLRNGISLILSDLACYVFNYSGDDYVYRSYLAGRGCGLLGPLGITELNGVAYWWGANDLWRYDGTLQKLPTDDIRDWVFNALDKKNAFKVVAGTIAARNEVWFFYPAIDDGDQDGSPGDGLGENSRYVIWHIDQQCFSTGPINGTTFHAVTSFLDNQYPSLVNSSESYNTPYVTVTGTSSTASGTYDTHRIRLFDHDGTAASDLLIRSPRVFYSPLEIARGNQSMDIFGAIVDFKPDGTSTNFSATLNFKFFDAPPSEVTTPYDVAHTVSTSGTPKIDFRHNARLIAHAIAINGTGRTRIGVTRLDMQPAGKRK